MEHTHTTCCVCQIYMRAKNEKSLVTVLSLVQLRSAGFSERLAIFQYTLAGERPSTGTRVITVVDTLAIVIIIIRYLGAVTSSFPYM